MPWWALCSRARAVGQNLTDECACSEKTAPKGKSPEQARNQVRRQMWWMCVLFQIRKTAKAIRKSRGIKDTQNMNNLVMDCRKKKKTKCGLILNNLWCVRRIHLTVLVRKFYFHWPKWWCFLEPTNNKINQNIAMNDTYVAIIMQLLFILFNHWNHFMDEEWTS